MALPTGRAAVLAAGAVLLVAASGVLLVGNPFRRTVAPGADRSAGGTAEDGHAPRPPAETPAPVSSPPPAPGGLPAFSHVFIVVMENQEFGSVIGNPTAPYINSLAQSYGLATQYYGITHPSLPNYLALTAGSTFGIASDCTTCFVNAINIVDQVEASGRSWKAYLEDMPSACYLGASAGNYALKHNPFLYFTDIRNDPARCAAHVVPFTRFATDLAGGAAPNYVWITPNLCHDMHDCPVSAGDRWLQSVVPSILTSAPYRDGGILFITFDEGTTSAGCCGSAAGGRVATLVVSPLARAGFKSTVAQTHFSLLRTIEDAWGLGELGGAACSCSTVMREYFR